MEDLVADGINAYFEDIKDLLKKIAELRQASDLSESQYKRIAIPALYALMEYIACSRYGAFSSSRRFKDLLTNYSGQKEELNKIDIVFLYQWDDSAQVDEGSYKKLIKKIHSQIKAALLEIYQKEKNIHIHMKEGERFIARGDLYRQILNKADVSESLLESSLDLFNRCSVIYLYGRCTTIHEGDFSPRGFINVEYLFGLLENVVGRLESECKIKNMLPFQLL